jgi:hypothetical protein
MNDRERELGRRLLCHVYQIIFALRYGGMEIEPVPPYNEADY